MSDPYEFFSNNAPQTRKGEVRKAFRFSQHFRKYPESAEFLWNFLESLHPEILTTALHRSLTDFSGYDYLKNLRVLLMLCSWFPKEDMPEELRRKILELRDAISSHVIEEQERGMV